MIKPSIKEKILNYEIEELYSKMSVINKEFHKHFSHVEKLLQRHMKHCSAKTHSMLKCYDFEDVQEEMNKLNSFENQKLQMSYRNVELQRERIEEMKAQNRPQDIIDNMERTLNELKELLDQKKEMNDAKHLS